MTFRLKIFFSGLLPVLGLFLLLGGCGEQDDQVLGPAGDDDVAEAYAWLWAYDADQDSLRVYDVTTGELHATFFANPHAILHEVIAGPEAAPTVWMGSSGTGFIFSAGFQTHADHAHMILPANLGTVQTGAGNTHLTTDPAGTTVSWANDGDQNFTLVDVETLAPSTVGHGSPHSSSLIADGTLLATHMNEKWARLIDENSGSILAQVAIDTLAHGEAFYEALGQAFIPCLNGITVVGFTEQENLGLIPYPGDGRVNFLFSGHGLAKALAPAKLADGPASDIWILDMQQRSMTSLNIPGSALDWSRHGGNLNLSADGSTAVFTDLETSRANVVDLLAETIENITTEQADMACALGYEGDQLWLLAKSSGVVQKMHRHEGSWQECTGFTVYPGSDWIFITSLDPAVEIIRDY